MSYLYSLSAGLRHEQPFGVAPHLPQRLSSSLRTTHRLQSGHHTDARLIADAAAVFSCLQLAMLYSQQKNLSG